MCLDSCGGRGNVKGALCRVLFIFIYFFFFVCVSVTSELFLKYLECWDADIYSKCRQTKELI